MQLNRNFQYVDKLMLTEVVEDIEILEIKDTKSI